MKAVIIDSSSEKHLDISEHLKIPKHIPYWD